MSKFLEVENLMQGSGEWKRWRRSGIGASEAPIIYYGRLFDNDILKLWEEKVGLRKRGGDDNEDTERGHRVEVIARQKFAEHTGIITEPVCLQSVNHPFLFASMDGMTRDRTIGVEIKAPGEKVFRKTLETGIPEYYIPQVQHQYAVSGAREMYFYAYNEDIAPHWYIQLVRPDYAMIEEMIRKDYAFWRHVENYVAPGQELSIQRANGTQVGVIMLSGYATVGKDECIGRIYQNMLNVSRYSPSDLLRKLHAEVLGMTEAEILKDKEKYRPGMVTLGDGMQGAVPTVWYDAIFNKGEIIRSMRNEGAIITSVRYVSDASYVRGWAEKLGVPSHVIYIDRPGFGPKSDAEARTVPLVKAVADVILVNDCDTDTAVGYRATEAACLAALNHLDRQITVKASDYMALARAELRSKTNDRQRKAKPKVTTRRGRR